MKTASLAKTVCAASLTALCVFGLSACSSAPAASSSNGVKLTGGVAATVNGAEIAEDDVTLAVENVRTQMQVTDTDAWGQWMADNEYTPEKVREEIIDSLTTKELIHQGAEEKGISVDSSEIDSYVDSMKSKYSSDEKWQEALSAANMTEDEYRSNIETSLLQQDLVASFGGEDPTDDELLQYANMYASSYDGAKRSSHILFDANDEETAQEVLDKINAGELDFADAAKEYSTDTGSAANGGDVGWDKLNSFVSEYTDALSGLEKGQVSGLVTSSYGIHIIKCTDVFNAPRETGEDGTESIKITSLDQLPSEFADSITSMVKQSKQSQEYQEWLTDLKDSADIVINDMPEGLPYDVDPSNYTPSEDSTAAKNASASSDDASADATSSDSDAADAGASDASGAEESAESSASTDAVTGSEPAAAADKAA